MTSNKKNIKCHKFLSGISSHVLKMNNKLIKEKRLFAWKNRNQENSIILLWNWRVIFFFENLLKRFSVKILTHSFKVEKEKLWKKENPLWRPSIYRNLIQIIFFWIVVTKFRGKYFLPARYFFFNDIKNREWL